MRRYHLFMLAVIVILTLSPTRVAAHPKIVSTTPAPNAQLVTAPTQIRIVFNEPIEAAFAQLRLYDAQAQAIDDGTGGRSADDPTILVLTPPPVAAGIYTVVWQVVGSDGHTIAGNFSFTVLTTTVTTPGPSSVIPTTLPTIVVPVATERVVPANESSPPIALVALLRALMLTGAALAVGGWVWLALVLRPAFPDMLPLLVVQRWRTLIQVGLAILCVALISFLLVHTQQVAGQIDGQSLLQVVGQTRLGQALGVRFLLALVLFGLLALRMGRWHLVWGAVPGAGLLATFAVSGHAAAQLTPLVPILADWMHLIATSLWVGGLAQLGVTLPIALDQESFKRRVNILTIVLQRFSAMALASVCLLVLTGNYAATLHLMHPSELGTTRYGQILLAKLLGVGALVLLGAYQILVVRRRVVTWPRRAAEILAAQHWHTRLIQVAQGEVALAVAVLACVGLLTSVAPPDRAPEPQANRPVSQVATLPTTTPPSTIRTTPTRTPVPSVVFDERQSAGDLLVGLRIAPASLGNNELQVRIQDRAGAPLAVQKVVLFTTMAAMDMGEIRIETDMREPGLFVAPKEWFSMVGEWTVRVSVRRADANDVEATFLVGVGEQP